MMLGQAGLCQQRHGVEAAEHRLKGFLKVEAQQIVVLQHTDPAKQADVECPLARAGPNEAEEAGEAGSLRINAGRGGKCPGTGTKFILCASEGGALL